MKRDNEEQPLMWTNDDLSEWVCVCYVLELVVTERKGEEEQAKGSNVVH